MASCPERRGLARRSSCGPGAAPLPPGCASFLRRPPEAPLSPPWQFTCIPGNGGFPGWGRESSAGLSFAESFGRSAFPACSHGFYGRPCAICTIFPFTKCHKCRKLKKYLTNQKIFCMIHNDNRTRLYKPIIWMDVSTNCLTVDYRLHALCMNRIAAVRQFFHVG